MTNASLQGLHIINTRPKHQASTWTRQLSALGAFVTEIPAIEIMPTKCQWLSTAMPLEQYQQIIFVSANSVNYFFSALPATVTVPKTTLISAVGKQTASHLKNYGLDALFPSVSDSEHLLGMPHLQHISHQSILLVKGIGGRRLITQTLKQRGANPQTINVYRRYCPNSPINVANVWKERRERIILVTSKAAIDNLFRMMPSFKNMLQQATWLTLSKRLASYAQKKGISHVLISDGENLINTLMLHQQGLAHD